MSRLLIHIKNFSYSPLFEDISLSVSKGECFALIGENGSGKTTLLRILAGKLLPEKVGFLPQEVLIKDDCTVREYLRDDLEKRMEEALHHPEGIAEWAALHEEYENRGGYSKPPLEKVLHGLKLQTALDQPMKSLSSGERVRSSLAKALLENPDLLLLDEPTNHLDSEMLAWLEEAIKNRAGGTIIVSHDRKFINKACNRLVEIKDRKLHAFGGNYDFYLAERNRRGQRELKKYEEQQERKKELKEKIKAMTFAKKKPTPPKDRNIMSYDKKGIEYEKSTQRILNALKSELEEIEKNALPHPKPKTITGLRFLEEPIHSEVAIEWENVSKKFGEKILFQGLSLRLKKGDRLIVKGANGSGKTTLLRCTLGLEKYEGTIKIAPSARISYLDQEANRMPMDQTPLEYFDLPEEELRRELHKSALGGEDLLRRPFREMSVGQRKRLLILKIVLERPNVLLLDEPTNHLDLLTLEALEKALLPFEGAILAVSHDETFISKIATEVLPERLFRGILPGN
jgi:ATP-binding cassette, subfamily F, member 3